jgi:APA family basic amino acid/polyamine antiporter
MKHSKMAIGDRKTRRGQAVFNLICIGLGVLCIITGIWHQQTVGMNADKSLLIIAVVFGLVHIAFYTMRLTRKAN